MNALELAKKHPVMVGVGAVVIIGGAILLFGGSDGSDPGTMTLQNTTAPIDPNQVAAGQQLQAMNMQLKASEAELAATKEVRLAEIAAQKERDIYAAKTSFDAAKLLSTRQFYTTRMQTTTQRIKQKQDVFLKNKQLNTAKLIAKMQADFAKKLAALQKQKAA